MKTAILLVLVLVIMTFTFCGGGKKAASAAKPQEVAKLTYEANVQPLITLKCSPCHIPPRGNKKPYVTYASVKEDIDDILTRVHMNPGERGFMPMRNPKLSDSAINVLEQWKKDGMLEK